VKREYVIQIIVGITGVIVCVVVQMLLEKKPK
jgi:hypothetical protein